MNLKWIHTINSRYSATQPTQHRVVTMDRTYSSKSSVPVQYSFNIVPRRRKMATVKETSRHRMAATSTNAPRTVPTRCPISWLLCVKRASSRIRTDTGIVRRRSSNTVSTMRCFRLHRCLMLPDPFRRWQFLFQAIIQVRSQCIHSQVFL